MLTAFEILTSFIKLLQPEHFLYSFALLDMMLLEKFEQRAVIKHCVLAGMTPVDMLKFMTAGNSCKRGLVYKWHARFSNGQENTADDDRDGRPKTTERVRSGI